MTFKMKYPIEEQLLTQRLNRPGVKGETRRFGVAHDTGNIDSTAKQNVSYLNRQALMSGKQAFEVSRQGAERVPFRVASAHSFTDDERILLCIPMDEKAWHVRYIAPQDNALFGCDANDAAVGHELCYFSDVNRTQQAYEKFVWLWAYTAFLYRWKSIRESITFHSVLDPKRKRDPMNAFEQLGKSYDGFLADVEKEYEACLVRPDKTEVPHMKGNNSPCYVIIETDVYDGVVINGVSYMPVRVYAEREGYTVTWNQEDAEVTLSRKDENPR